jgi:CheY-like chemotaxis protein
MYWYSIITLLPNIPISECHRISPLHWGDGRLPRVLIVDDEPQIRTLLSMSLRMVGYDVTAAADGFEAMTLCTAETFDAILTDIDMPRMNGHELVRWVARNRPLTRYALMSGLGPEYEECPVNSPLLLLHKPFFPKEAVALIEQILNA